jgi:DNA-binding GntR family transcriptional regulator
MTPASGCAVKLEALPHRLRRRASGCAAKLEALPHRLRRRAPRAGRIAETIRETIVAGDLKPRSRIVGSRIARQIGVGQPTVREALALEHRGLLVRQANRGCVVRQALRIRAELKCLAVDLAGRVRQAAGQRNIEEFFALHRRFHETLWKLSGSSLLPRLLAQTPMPRLAFLFIRNLHAHRPVDMRASAAAHAEVAAAILTRDPREAPRVAHHERPL